MTSARHIPIQPSDIQQIDAAPLYMRLSALMIDGVILALPVYVYTDMVSEGLFALAGSLMIPIMFLPGAILLATLEWLTGKTVGKMVMGIRVTGVEDGKPIGFIRALGRRAFMVMESYVMFIPSLVLIPFNSNFDGHLGDRLTGAIVARDSDITQAFQRTRDNAGGLMPDRPSGPGTRER